MCGGGGGGWREKNPGNFYEFELNNNNNNKITQWFPGKNQEHKQGLLHTLSLKTKWQWVMRTSVTMR